MTCSVCHQNEATIHLTEIINNQMVEVHLCETCAEEKGADFKTHFNFGDLLSGLTDIGSALKPESKSAVKCKACGMSFEEFGKSGRLGCASCYQELSKTLLPLIKRVQRTLTHIGKKPSRISKDVKRTVDLRDMHERLRKAIQTEEFEEAAKLRDQIKKFEEKPVRGKKSDGK